ncbi:glycosyltransferase family 2 protein [Actimicrobium sp. CCI2.3]|uniref:glycosyltransferase family 2 protein n=1 Tax=Actimicrobium sp. CCI2.3 TaxID=3048616 RepID=UPI002AB407F8|nr:glycosyltransferase family 2 protein [Actimicrobium sp. CCI2.3]MDY7575210.1 glycosyltransferase family 2 protein [Actimicrobium sp. CCI2.3]MEB0022327.1 glycosyltransferase family 2 protein [Actimicrobium sp. CCI2.3]
MCHLSDAGRVRYARVLIVLSALLIALPLQAQTVSPTSAAPPMIQDDIPSNAQRATVTDSPAPLAPDPEQYANGFINLDNIDILAARSVGIRDAMPTISDRPLVALMAAMLFFIVLIMALYGVRHFVFTLSRLFGKQRHPYIDIDQANWPMITVFIAAHNEEKVIAGCIEALLDTNYPADLLKIVPVNDRSLDRTREIIDSYVARFPGRITPFHRLTGKAGKAAALKDALTYVEGDIVIIFDADYVPGRGLLKQLVAPFFDPEVGAVMGRVVPMNAGTNLLTRMLDLERSGGYQVDQQARMNLRLLPQYGGTVGGVRCSAVDAVGGWHDDILAEDTDITYRLMLNGWKTVYTNRSECYEEVPEDWAVRIKQVKRWSKGHNQVMVRYWYSFLTSQYLSPRERIDGMLLLLVFIVPLLLLIGWFIVLALYFANAGSLLNRLIPAFALMAFSTLGNFAAFFEIAIAVLLDGNRKRLRLLPFNLLCFFISLFAISHASWSLLVDWLFKREMVWDKTIRYRQPPVP